MKHIAFNVYNTGLANNGGSQTVVRMTGQLASMGNHVEIWGNTSNRFTWFPLHPDVTYRHLMSLDDAPDADALISIGCNSVKPTREFPRARVKANWIRAIETWSMSKEQLFKQYAWGDLKLFVNAPWMRDAIQQGTGRSDIGIVYSGVPINDFYPTEQPVPNRIGALYSPKARKRWKDVRKLVEKLKVKGVKAEFVAFGNEGGVQNKDRWLAHYHRQPDLPTKRNLYSSCMLWFAPTENEGLHIPPLEAGLCGVVTVGNAVKSSGLDTCIHGISGFRYESLDEAAEQVKFAFSHPEHLKQMNRVHRTIIRHKVGDVAKNAERLLENLFGTQS